MDIFIDPVEWSQHDVQSWLKYTLSEFNIADRNNLSSRFEEDGTILTLFNENEFVSRLGDIGSIIFAKLEILKMIFGGNNKGIYLKVFFYNLNILSFFRKRKA